MNQIIQNKLLINMPIELLIMIFSHINDTDTYKNTRSVCRFFREILFDIKVFNNEKLYLIFSINESNNRVDDITIMDPNRLKIGYIKTEFPACARYYLKKDNKIIENIINPNEVITKEITDINNIQKTKIVAQKTKIVVQNLKTRTHKTSTLTKVFPNAYHQYIPPNGCIIN